MRTVFLGSPPFATPILVRLMDSPHRPAAVLTQPARPRGRGRKLEASPLEALAAGAQFLAPPDPHAPEVLARLRELAPEVLLVASYGVILKPDLLGLAPHAALNVHASLLPRHRGASPIQAAILAGDARTGVSIQRIVARLDEGDVLLARELALTGTETAGELLAALARLGAEAAVEALDQLAAGSAVFTPQDPARATYARKLDKRAGGIAWARPAPELARQILALNPWPLARCVDPAGEELLLLRARPLAGSHAGVPGEILEAGARFVVATGAGALELLEVCRPGKRALAAAEFLRGARLRVGARLGDGARS